MRRRRCTHSSPAPAGVVLVAVLLVFTLLPAAPAAAQEQPNPDELKRLYDEAIAQLKASQDRKNELAADNEKLKARIAELEAVVADRDRAAAGFAERTWFYRSHYAAWDRFLARYPRLHAQWKEFLATSELDPLGDLPSWTEPSVTKAD